MLASEPPSWKSKRRLRPAPLLSGLPLRAGAVIITRVAAAGQHETEHLPQTVELLFNYFIGVNQDRWLHNEAEYYRCSLVDYELELGWLFDWQFGRISALQ